MKEWFLRASISLKLTAFLLVISVVPLGLYLLVSYSVTRDTIVDLATQHSRQLLNNQRDYLELQMDQIVGLMSNLSGVAEVDQIMTAGDRQRQNAYDRLATNARIGYILSNYTGLRGLVSLDIFTVGGLHFHVGDAIQNSEIDSATRDRLLRDSISAGSAIAWHGVEENINTGSDNRKVLVATKVIYRTSASGLSTEPAGVLMVAYSTDLLHKHFSAIDLGQGAQLLVVDGQRRLLFHADRSRIGQPIPAALDSLLVGNSRSTDIDVDGRSALLSYIQIPEKNWYLISIVPQQTLMAPMSGIQNAAGMVIFLSLGLLIAFFALFSKYFVAPIKRISDGFRDFRSGHLAPAWRLPKPTSQDEIGQLATWFNAFLDTMDERQRNEVALRVAKETAEKALQDLRAAQIQMVQSEKLASLGALVAGVAHELNTPIGNSLLVSSTLRDDIAEIETDIVSGELRRSSFVEFLGKIRNMVTLLERNIVRAADLVSSFKRVAVDQTSEQRRVFDLASVVDDVLSSLQPSLKRDPCRMVVHVPSGIVCDSYPGPLGQVLTNLIQNAALHGFSGRSDGEVTIQASLTGDQAVISVRDNGVGMDATTLARIFDPFFTTRLGQGGSGLGLAICRNMVDGVLGGGIHATSTPGLGTCFVVQFPTRAPAMRERKVASVNC